MRYAVYFTPESSTELWHFGASILGYDSYTGREVAFPGTLPGGLNLSTITASPRRYGFHATLKAPFQMHEGMTEDMLLAHARSFSRRQRAFFITPLVLASLGSFLALRPQTPDAALNRLAADCVVEFDAFRASLTVADRARRLAVSLTERQIAHLDRWGYPYVLEEFRFHMTLTNALDTEELACWEAALRGLYPSISEPIAVDAISIVRQDGPDKFFRVLERFPFA